MSSIDSVFKQLNREIWIVTAADGERRGGLVATWVSQASLDPAEPLVVAALARNHFTHELVAGGGRFAVHLIAPEQIELAWRFTLGSGRDRDKFAGLSLRDGDFGAPILADCLAWLDCRVVDRYQAADRTLFWGEVLAGGVVGSGPPLCEQELFNAATDEQKQALRQDMEQDIAIQRPWIQGWKMRSPHDELE